MPIRYYPQEVIQRAIARRNSVRSVGEHHYRSADSQHDDRRPTMRRHRWEPQCPGSDRHSDHLHGPRQSLKSWEPQFPKSAVRIIGTVWSRSADTLLGQSTRVWRRTVMVSVGGRLGTRVPKAAETLPSQSQQVPMAADGRGRGWRRGSGDGQEGRGRSEAGRRPNCLRQTPSIRIAAQYCSGRG